MKAKDLVAVYDDAVKGKDDEKTRNEALAAVLRKLYASMTVEAERRKIGSLSASAALVDQTNDTWLAFARRKGFDEPGVTQLFMTSLKPMSEELFNALKDALYIVPAPGGGWTINKRQRRRMSL